MKKYIILILSLGLLATANSYAASKVATTAAQFLKIEIGARGLAMGGAYVATADDATATFWNPAGLARLQSREVAVSHAEWLADMNVAYGSIVVPFGGQTVGLSMTVLDYGEWEMTTIDEPEGTGERFGAQDLALGLSYARSLTDRFSFGANVKYINQRISHSNASAIAFDIGTLFITQLKGLRIGMCFSNFGNKMSMQGRDSQVLYDVAPDLEGNDERINAHLETDEWDLPLSFRVGVAMDVIDNSYSKLILALDTVAPNDNLEYVNAGFEYGLRKLLFLRAGYKSLFRQDSEDGLTLGTGIRYAINRQMKIRFDYAYADFGRLDYIQRFSVAFSF
ncbi:PorV/PorQ family protein [candidate division KSB1 bacterium]|nr:PorV/PorQ family protein [candidate division KSB1 bacterium]